MPDAMTHILIAYSLCTILGFKYKQFNTENTVIAMVGALLPDLVKLAIPIQAFSGYDISVLISTFHMPAGTLILAAMFSLLFKEKKTVFLFLVFGFLTHFGLDLLMTYYAGGIYLLYPLSWSQYQLGLITTVDYNINFISLILAILVFGISHTKKIKSRSIS
jgi:LexA-binding, inner membrane-associated putative hydrolase